MKIWLRIHGFEPCSWTFVWDNLRKAFEAQGDEVWFADDPSDPEEWVEVWWGDPQFWQWSELPVRAKIAIALSEAHSILIHGKSTVISNLSLADTIICPSEFAAIAFRESPIDVPIKVVFFGVNPDEFRYIDRDWYSTFKFLHGGVTQFRKGSWMVPEAFIQAFNENEDVELTISTPKVTEMYTRLRYEYEKHPKITFLCDLQETSMALYENNHVYVSPHLSEGFGLMPLEALSTGMGCLVARCSSPREYFDKKYGWWIEMSDEYGPVFPCLPDTNGFWRLPDVDSLAEVMRESYEDREESKSRGLLGSQYVREFLTWDICATKIKEIIREVIDAKNIGDIASV